MDKFPTKRDYWYGFAIAIIAMLFLVVSFIVSPNKLNSELGLASTLASIILSVIAIIYTLVDSSNNKKTAANIITASETITSATEDIDTSTGKLSFLIDKLEELDLHNKLLRLEQSVKGIDESVLTVDTKIDSNMSDIKNTLNLFTQKETTPQGEHSKSYHSAAIHIFYNLSDRLNARRLLYLVGLAALNENINAVDVINYAIETMKADQITEKYKKGKYYEGVFLTLIEIYSTLGCFQLNEDLKFINMFCEIEEINKWIEVNDKKFAAFAKAKLTQK